MLYVKKLGDCSAVVPPAADMALVGEEVLVRISRLGFSLTYLPSPNAQWRNFPPSPYASAMMQLSGTVRFGAFLDDALIGAAAIRVIPGGWAEILDIRVDAASRRIGAGKAMLGACQSWAENHQTSGLKLITTDQNPGMCQFCEHEGFRLQGMDRMALAMTEQERSKPLVQRACELIFYKQLKKG